MAAVRDLPVLGNSSQTLGQAYAALVGDMAQQVQALDQRQTNQSSFMESLKAQQQSVSGVDPNEELVKMLEFQRTFQLASRYISTVNEALPICFASSNGRPADRTAAFRLHFGSGSTRGWTFA